jgi:2,4-diketo-3-deoxy-L-fuconate hydrolase
VRFAHPPLRRLLELLPERRHWKLFLRCQGRRPHYLKPGDRIDARIWSRDGSLDLGEQNTEIVA